MCSRLGIDSGHKMYGLCNVSKNVYADLIVIKICYTQNVDKKEGRKYFI